MYRHCGFARCRRIRRPLKIPMRSYSQRSSRGRDLEPEPWRYPNQTTLRNSCASWPVQLGGTGNPTPRGREGVATAAPDVYVVDTADDEHSIRMCDTRYFLMAVDAPAICTGLVRVNVIAVGPQHVRSMRPRCA